MNELQYLEAEQALHYHDLQEAVGEVTKTQSVFRTAQNKETDIRHRIAATQRKIDRLKGVKYSCHSCNGNRGYWENGMAHTTYWMTCDTCNGTGKVDP